MLVSGVLRSWLTFVMSSVLNLSDFMRSFTARFMPMLTALRLSPCSLSTGYIFSVSTV